MNIDIAAISLDVQNFRHGEVATEREAIQLLLSDEKTHKVTELALDIIEMERLDPSSLLIVTEDLDKPGHYIALEGNRRITALKTLMTPDLAVGTPGYAQFKALHQRFIKLNINSVECVVLDRAQASVWIKRKHYKGMGGAGVVAWNAVATARSDASEGRFTRWMTALSYLEQHGVEAEDIRDRISNKTTTIERVLASTYMFSILGLTFGKDGSLFPENGDTEAAVLLLKSLLDAMSERSFVETRVSSADQQRAFIESFAPMHVRRLTPSRTDSNNNNSSKKTSHDTTSSTTPGASVSKRADGDQPTAAASGVSGGAIRSKPVKVRKKLASPGLRISNQPLNKFYSELRSLDVEKNPHVAAAIIRVFVEKSSTVFLDTMKIPPLNTKPGATWHDYGIKLREKVQATLNQIDPGKKNSKLSYVWDIANGDRDKIHTTDHLNKAIHSHLSLPSHSEIITIWDRFHPYFLEIFEMIENRIKS